MFLKVIILLNKIRDLTLTIGTQVYLLKYSYWKEIFDSIYCYSYVITCEILIIIWRETYIDHYLFVLFCFPLIETFHRLFTVCNRRCYMNFVFFSCRVVLLLMFSIVTRLIMMEANSCFSSIIIFGKVSAQPHTILKQICFPNGNVLFLSLFSLFKNWMYNVYVLKTISYATLMIRSFPSKNINFELWKVLMSWMTNRINLSDFTLAYEA